MEVNIVGTGHAATILGRLMKQAGHRVLQVQGRQAGRAAALAQELGASWASWPAPLPPAQFHLLAVADAALATVAAEVAAAGGMLLHCAGSVPMAVLSAAPNHGVLYPLQSLRADAPLPRRIPLLVEANGPDQLALLTDFAHSLSPEVAAADSTQRLHYHLAAVVVNNFTNQLQHLAWQHCQQHQLSFGMLQALAQHTVERLQPDEPPARWQTGPAVRGDGPTIDRHLQLLADEPNLAAVYRALTTSIAHTHQQD